MKITRDFANGEALPFDQGKPFCEPLAGWEGDGVYELEFKRSGRRMFCAVAQRMMNEGDPVHEKCFYEVSILWDGFKTERVFFDADGISIFAKANGDLIGKRGVNLDRA